jgi:hypothetical protein
MRLIQTMGVYYKTLLTDPKIPITTNLAIVISHSGATHGEDFGILTISSSLAKSGE